MVRAAASSRPARIGSGASWARREARRRHPPCRNSDRRCPRTRAAAVAAPRSRGQTAGTAGVPPPTPMPFTSSTPARARAAKSWEVPAGTVAPGVGHRLDHPLRGAEWCAARRTRRRPSSRRQQVLRAKHRGVDQLRPAEGHPRDRQRDWRCRPCRASSWGRATRHRTRPPVQAGLAALRRPDQGVRAGGRKVLPVSTADPHGGHDDPGSAHHHVVETAAGCP